MLHHTGTDREQLTMFPLSLDEMVDQDNPVRIIDLFVNRFDFVKPDGPRSCEIPTPLYYSDKFIYDAKKDVHVCPQNQVLKEVAAESLIGAIFLRERSAFYPFKKLLL